MKALATFRCVLGRRRKNLIHCPLQAVWQQMLAKKPSPLNVATVAPNRHWSFG
jgi:hypothetical protein